MSLYISPKTLAKLEDAHGVTKKEVDDCFLNAEGPYLADKREQHKSNPPTHWFLARTNKGRLLKIVFIQRDDCISIRTAYEPNQNEIAIYARNSK